MGICEGVNTMNRKHNPWVALTALILLAAILAVACI